MTLSVDLTHSFGAFTLQAAFQAPPGITVLYGRSGSGKTTIVNAVAGLLAPRQGRITIDRQVLLDTTTGTRLPPHRRALGVIFQEGRLFPHLSVRANLLYGRRFARRAGTAHQAAPDFDHVVDMLGIGPLLARRPAKLSGGEKQRVAIGRALLANPGLILADEPLAALDDARKEEILPYFERLRDETAIPILYVSHSEQEVARLATWIVALDHGQITAQGPAAEMLGDPMFTPTGARAAGAVIEAEVAAHHDDGLSELAAGGVPLLVPRIPQAPGTRLRLRIAAQDVILARQAPEGLSALNILAGQVATLRTGDGPGTLVSVTTPAGPVLARITGRSAAALELAPGVDCHVIVKALSIAPGDVGGAGSEPGPDVIEQ